MKNTVNRLSGTWTDVQEKNENIMSVPRLEPASTGLKAWSSTNSCWANEADEKKMQEGVEEKSQE